MTKILGIEVEPIENFVKANFDPRVNKKDGSKFKSCSTWPWTGCRGKE